MAKKPEKHLRALKDRLRAPTVKHNLEKKRKWQETFGLSRDDDGFREMVELGEQYRRNLGSS
jgi:hypothetical protein